MAKDKQHNTGAVINGLMLGLLVSAPIVAWLSPKSGPERRETLLRSVSNIARKPLAQVQQQVDRIKGESLTDALDEGRSLAARRASNGSQQ